MIETSLLLIALLALSGFFSGSEIAFFSLSQARTRTLADEGRRGSRALVELKASPDRLLITILIGNNVANIAAASLATLVATRAVGSAGVGLATGVMTLLVLFFGEIVPKSFAAANAVRLSLLAAPIIHFLSRALFFLVVPLEALTRSMLPPTGVEGRPGVTEGEIRALTRLGYTSGAIEEYERELIERAFLLDATEAWAVMTPRVDIFAWPESFALSEIAGELPTVPYSRIPVYEESLDEVSGVLYLRDAYQALLAGRGDMTLGELAREPFFLPASVPLIEALGEFQARRMHLGVVVDEYGGTDGIITLEDILEELVGEIMDEVDVPEEPLVRVNRNEILVDGSADLREINHFFNASFPLLEHRSLNGYLLSELGRVPEPEERIERQGIEIEVLSASETQVNRARLTRRSGVAATAGRGATDPSAPPPADEAERGGRGRE